MADEKYPVFQIVCVDADKQPPDSFEKDGIIYIVTNHQFDLEEFQKQREELIEEEFKIWKGTQNVYKNIDRRSHLKSTGEDLELASNRVMENFEDLSLEHLEQDLKNQFPVQLDDDCENLFPDQLLDDCEKSLSALIDEDCGNVFLHTPLDDGKRCQESLMDVMIPIQNTGPSSAAEYLPSCLEHNLNWGMECLQDGNDCSFKRQHNSIFCAYPHNSKYCATLFDELCDDDEDDSTLPHSSISCSKLLYEDIYNSEHMMCDDGPQRFSKLLKFDCKWTGCDQECEKTHYVEDLLDDCMSDKELLNPNFVWPIGQLVNPPYTPKSDHSYSASQQDIITDIPTPPSSSESSEDEVDVVTVPEEHQPPVVHSIEELRRSTRYQGSLKKPDQTGVTGTRFRSVKKFKGRKRQKCEATSKYQAPSPSTSTASSLPDSRHCSDAEDSEKRRTHNYSERRRRELQRTALQDLRVCIPELENNPKSAKVLIINSATNLIKRLERENRTLGDDKGREFQRNNELKFRLKQLRSKLKF